MRDHLRGALLSVLFFTLILGGAPAMAAAGQPTSVTSAIYPGGASECESSGGNWVGSNGYIDPKTGHWTSIGPFHCHYSFPATQEESCQSAQEAMNLGGGGMAGGALWKKLPLVGPIGAGVFLVGLGKWLLNDCGNQ